MKVIFEVVEILEIFTINSLTFNYSVECGIEIGEMLL